MIYVISDLHGYPHSRILDLLRIAGFSKKDFLYILGDVVDRNLDGGIRTLLWLLDQPNTQLILGNHEAMLLSCEFLFEEITEDSIENMTAERMGLLNTYLMNGGNVTLKALRELTPESRQDILDYLKDAPLYEAVSVNNRDYLLVHAGLDHFRPDKKLSEYEADDFLWKSPRIDERYYDDIITVFGHLPTFRYGKEYEGKIIRTETWIGIDAGAGHGYDPVLLRLDDGKEFTFRHSRDRYKNS